jgi:hypothetical protein
MRALAMTGMETAWMICLMRLGLAMRATPPSARIMAGTRSRAMTETAPASSAMRACSTFITSMMTPPLSISARPTLRRRLVPVKLLFSLIPAWSSTSEREKTRASQASGRRWRDCRWSWTWPFRCASFACANLLALAPGQVIESQWNHGIDLPLAAGDVQLAWSEFEVVDSQLAVRVTRLA